MSILYTNHLFSTTKCLFITNRGFSNNRYLFSTTSCLLSTTSCLLSTTGTYLVPLGTYLVSLGANLGQTGAYLVPQGAYLGPYSVLICNTGHLPDTTRNLHIFSIFSQSQALVFGKNFKFPKKIKEISICQILSQRTLCYC